MNVVFKVIWNWWIAHSMTWENEMTNKLRGLFQVIQAATGYCEILLWAVAYCPQVVQIRISLSTVKL